MTGARSGEDEVTALKTYHHLFVLCCLIVLAGCIAPATQGDLSTLDKKVIRQRKEVQEVRQKQADLETQVDAVKADTHIGKNDQELRQLQEEVAMIKTMLGMKVTEPGAAPDLKLREDFPQAAAPAAAPPGNLANVAGSPDPEELYNSGYSKLSKGDFKGAREEFKKFLELFPQTEYSDNAQFGIGEAYYKEKKYEEAILEYEEVVKKFPQGNKLPDAMLKQAFAFIALNDGNSAKLLLQKIIERFPTSEQAEVARSKLRSLR
ncbi:MAG: tol-pal system protein [Deltaproteobacteria bacterium]|nr:tol-pal system protein [Deltaproteobacteria bacterium]